jgi:hypothetical protein
VTTAALLEALDVPAGSRVDQRVPKSLLVENGAPTAADKRLVNDGIERLQWHAAIKPSNSGIPEYRDETRHYVEVAVLELTLRPKAKTQRLTELTHRAVPYPVVLLVGGGGPASLSVVHKRWSQVEADRVVLEGALVTAQPYVIDDASITAAFLAALPLGQQPQTSLHGLYQGWVDTVIALQAAARVGRFVTATSAVTASSRRVALQECTAIESEMTSLRTEAAKTKQVARRAEINLALQHLKSRYAAAQAQL